MNKLGKLSEMEALWKSGKTVRDMPWSAIDWESGRFGDCDLQKHFVKKVVDRLATETAFFYVWGDREDAAGWLEWDYVLASWLYAWYQLPEHSDAPFMVNQTLDMICIPESKTASKLATLFRGPNSMVLGMDGLEERLEQRRRETWKGRVIVHHPGTNEEKFSFVTK